MKSFYEFYRKIQEQGPQPGAPTAPNTAAPPQAKPAQGQGAGTAPPVPPDLGIQSQISQLIPKIQNPKLKAALQAAIQQGQQQGQQPQQGQPPAQPQQQPQAPTQPPAQPQGQPPAQPQPQPPKPGMTPQG